MSAYFPSIVERIHYLDLLIIGGHGVYVCVYVSCDKFISMCSAPHNNRRPSRKIVGGQIDKVIWTRNTAHTHTHTS